LAVRRAFVPQPGWLLLSADYSQIEPRILAHLSQDERLLEAFRNSEDIYRFVGGVLFDKSAEEVTKHERDHIVKPLVLGINYGLTPYGLAENYKLLTNGLSMSEAEASRIIEQLSQADVDDVGQEGDAFRVTLRVLGGTVTHLLKMPSAKDVFEYRRGFARVLDLPYNRQELTINLGAAGALYKKLATGTEGYSGDVPIIHQAVTVKAAIDALDAAFQNTPDPNS